MQRKYKTNGGSVSRKIVTVKKNTALLLLPEDDFLLWYDNVTHRFRFAYNTFSLYSLTISISSDVVGGASNCIFGRRRNDADHSGIIGRGRHHHRRFFKRTLAEQNRTNWLGFVRAMSSSTRLAPPPRRMWVRARMCVCICRCLLRQQLFPYREKRQDFHKAPVTVGQNVNYSETFAKLVNKQGGGVTELQ